MELVLIRHALPIRVEETEGPADPSLSEEGRAQSEALAEWLSSEPVDAVYASPLRRARETAAAFERRTGHDAVVDEGLTEFDRGLDFYIPLEELKAMNHPRWQTLAHGKWDELEIDPFEFREVVVATLERIIDTNPSRRVLVFCHGGVVNAFASHVMGIASPLFFAPDYTGFSRFLASSDGARSVVSLNETPHLRGRPPIEPDRDRRAD